MTSEIKSEVAEFSATIDGGLFRAWVEAIVSITDEVILDVGRSGITVKAVDPAHVSMVQTTLKRSAFTKLYVSRPGIVGINMEKVGEVLRAVKKGQEVRIDVVKSKDKDGPDQEITIMLGSITRQFGSVDVNSLHRPNNLKLDFKGEFQITHSMWEGAIRQAMAVSDHVILMMSKKKKLYINAENDEGKVVNEIPYDLLAGPVVGGSFNIRSLYPLEYLHLTIKQGKTGMKRLFKGHTLTIKINNEYPMSLGVYEDDWDFTMLLAPRVERD